MKLFIIAFLVISCNHSVAQVNFAIGNYYRLYLRPSERYYKELKMGFDQEFYTPLVLKLKGNINACTVEEIIPEKEAHKAKIYKENKRNYEYEESKKLQNAQNKKKRKRKKDELQIDLLPARRNLGYYAYNFVYRFDDHNQMSAVTLNEVTLFDYNETEVRNSLSLFALTWKNNKPEALYFQDREKKERNSTLCIISYFDYFKEPGYTRHLHFSKEAAIDTTEKNYIKLDTGNRFIPVDSVNDKLNMQTMHRLHKNGTSFESGFYVLQENDTLYKFKQYYNAQGLLVKRIVYDRDLYSKKYDSSIETEVFEYTYDNDGKPTSLSYKEGISEPVVFNLKFTVPDKNGNPQRMQVYDQYDVLLREVGWYIQYRE